MTAEAVHDALVRHACGPSPATPPVPAATEAGALYAHISATYRTLRIGLAVIALGLPVALWIGSGGPRPSISDYYHAGGWMRDLFVGSLCAIAAFLVLYRGYSRAEDRLLDVAGAAAAVVALVPTDRREVPGVLAERTTGGLVHLAAAVLFFLLIAAVCVFLSRETLEHMEPGRQRRRFARAYRALGAAMLAAPALAWAVRYLPGAGGYPYVFFAEFAGVAVFAAFWLTKSREIAILERR